ncbi:MAG: hypothetical protein PSV16_11475 [Flavobacterium sp.]|nr:hypothetical protein [Flavobacterium sp.]
MKKTLPLLLVYLLTGCISFNMGRLRPPLISNSAEIITGIGSALQKHKAQSMLNHSKLFHRSPENKTDIEYKKDSTATTVKVAKDLNKILKTIVAKAKKLETNKYIIREKEVNLDNITVELVNSSSSFTKEVDASLGQNKIFVNVTFLKKIIAYVIRTEKDLTQATSEYSPIDPEMDEFTQSLFKMGDAIIDNMTEELIVINSSISYENLLRFIVAHEFVHIWLDSRSLAPSLENETRADALGFLLMAETSQSYKEQKKAQDEFQRTLTYSASGTYEIALLSADNGASFLFTAFQELGIERNVQNHPSNQDSIESIENLNEKYFEYKLSNKDYELFYWASNYKLKKNENN